MVVVNRSGKYVKLIIYLVVIVLVNLVGLTLFFRADLTKNNVYSISKASQKVVSTLSEPLTVNVFFTKNLPAPHNNTERYLHDLLEEYAVYGNRYFNYTFYDVNPEAEGGEQTAQNNQSLAEDYGIRPVQIQAVEKDEIKFQRAYMGLVLIHGDIIERIPTIGSTEGLEYKLTTAIQKLNNKISALLRLENKIQVKLFLSSSLKQVAPVIGLKDLPGLSEEVERIVSKVNDKNYGKIAFSRFDPSENQNDATEAKKYKLVNLQWPALTERNVQSGNGVIGLVLEHKDKKAEIQLLNVLRIPIIGTQYQLINVEDLEEIIGEHLESLIDINENLGYLADHGTPGVSAFSRMNPMMGQDQNMLSNFQTLASQTYTIKDVRLKDNTFLDGFDCLVIAQPTEPFTDYELYQIDQLLMRGKRLAIFMNSFNEVQQPNQQQFGYNSGPSYIPLNTGLERLLDHWGIRIKNSIVMDENCYKQQVPPQLGGGEQKIFFAPIIKQENINNSIDFMKNIKGMVAFKMSPLEADAARLSKYKITAHKLFSSSEKSWEMTENINLNPMFIQPPPSDDEKQSLALAYLLEGEFPSYFKGKPIPETKSAESNTTNDVDADGTRTSDTKQITEQKPQADLSKIEGNSVLLEKSLPSRILVVGSAEMLKDNILDAAGESPNAMFIMNGIDALNQREDIAVMRSKVQRFNPLMDTAPMTKTIVKSFNIAGLPVLVVCFGMLVWFVRHSRKKRIQMMFQK